MAGYARPARARLATRATSVAIDSAQARLDGYDCWTPALVEQVPVSELMK